MYEKKDKWKGYDGWWCKGWWDNLTTTNPLRPPTTNHFFHLCQNFQSMPIAPSELILNPDGSIFHLHLLPEQIAHDIIVVGDQGRVETISKHFDTIECKVSNREFTTHTGIFRGKRIAALSTGIGTDNIDIVLN